MKLLKYFLLLLLPLFYGNSYSNPLDSFIASLNEQSVSVEWVKNNAHNSLSDTQAKRIVQNTYAQAFSKDISPQLVLSMIKTESGFREKIRSREGAMGLMQVIPKWHKDKLQGRNPSNPIVSIEVGTTILSDCLTKYNNNHLKSLNCYSGGGGVSYYNRVKVNQENLKVFVKNMNSSNTLIVAKL